MGQSFTMWPGEPQNIQRLLSIRRWRSAGVSLPSLPSLLSMLLLVDLAEEEVLPEEFDLELELDLFLPLELE